MPMLKKEEVAGRKLRMPKRMRIKKMATAIKKDIEEQNKARALAKLPLIEIKVRKCLSCGTLFESAGERNCGCITQDEIGVLSGRDII